MRPNLRIALGISILLAGCGARSKTVERGAPTAPISSAQLALSYETLLAEQDERIGELQALAVRDGGWLTLSEVGRAQLGRARLSGRFADYAEAGLTLERSAKLAARGSGPLLARAEFALAIHDVSGAEALLRQHEQQPLHTPAQHALAQQLRWDLALARNPGALVSELQQKGDSNPERELAAALRLGLALHESGEFESSRSAFERARSLAESTDARTRAWIELQLGLNHLAERSLDDADAAYLRADALLSDWWLVLEHRAEVAQLQGRDARAEELYRRVVEHSDRPQYIRALAALTASESERALLSARARDRELDDERRLPGVAAKHRHAEAPANP